MVGKKKYLTLTLLFSLMFALTMVSAAITFNTPSSAGDTVTGTYVFNVTTTLTNTANCSWATTADSIFNTTANISTSQTVFNVSFDTTTLTDAEDTTLTVTCTNTTASTDVDTLLINVDNTAPVCSFSKDRETAKVNDGLGVITTQGSTDTTDLTYSWVLTRSGVTSTTSTVASPTFIGEDFDQIDEFTLALTVTDEASQSTACTNQSITVQGSNGKGVVFGTVGAAVTDNLTTIIIFAIVLIIVIIAIIAFLMVQKTKR